MAELQMSGADRTGLLLQLQAFAACGDPELNNSAALQLRELDDPWAQDARTRIHAGLFEHITTKTNR